MSTALVAAEQRPTLSLCDSLRFGNLLPFEKRVGELWGKKFNYYSLIGRLPHHRRAIHDLFNNAQQDVFVGFLDGHVYVSFDSWRLDGGSLGHFSRSYVRNNSHLSSGVIVRIRGVPENISQDLAKHFAFEKQPLPLTCSSGVCSFVRASGIHTPGLLNILPRQYLRNLMTGTIRDRDGKTLAKDIILLSGLPRYDSIEHFYSIMKENWDGGGISN